MFDESTSIEMAISAQVIRFTAFLPIIRQDKPADADRRSAILGSIRIEAIWLSGIAILNELLYRYIFQSIVIQVNESITFRSYGCWFWYT